MIISPTHMDVHVEGDAHGLPGTLPNRLRSGESIVAADFLAHGYSVEEMAIQFPSLTPSMILSALAYYYDHREEYEEALTASLNSCREKAAAIMDSPLRKQSRSTSR